MSTKAKPFLDDCKRSLFMKLYESQTVLWNKNHVHYKDYAVRQTAYENIVEQLQIDGLTPAKVVNLYHNMQTSYVKLKKQGKLIADKLSSCKEWVVIMDSFMGDEVKLGPPTVDHGQAQHNHKPVDSCKRLSLLESYRDKPVLWHPQHSNYKHTYHRDQAWAACADRVGYSIAQCRKMIHNMRTLYVKKRKLQATGPFSADEKTNAWMTAMDAFLGPVLFPMALKAEIKQECPVTEKMAEPDFEDMIVEDDGIEEEIISEENFELLICRCCLRQCDESDVKSIDSTFRDGIVYAQIYKDCIGYNHADSNQRLAATICSACESLLLELYEFRKLCRNNEDTYLATIQLPKVQEVAMVDLKIERLESGEDLIQEIEFSADSQYEETVGTEEEYEEVALLEQSSMPESYLDDSVQETKTPEPTHSSGGPQSLTCPHCQLVFKATRYLKRHFQFSCTKNPNFDRSKLPVCPICGKQVTRLAIHMKTHRCPTAAERFRCTMCERSFKSKLYLDGHVKHTHLNHTYSCQYCDATFKSWNGKRNHVHQKHMDARPYLCEVFGCQRAFLQMSQLNYHKRKAHSTEPPPSFVCEICGAKFTKKETLKVHHEAKHLGQTVSCDVCNKTFACKKLLMNHSKLHTGEKNYKCPVCDPPVAFAQNHVLRNHCAKMHPEYQLPPKGTVVSARALERKARQEALDKTLVKIAAEDFD